MTFASRSAIPLATAMALVAFAANSVLCRAALGRSTLDAATFTAIRLASGAVLLLAIQWRMCPSRPLLAVGGSWASALALFGYAITFSWAYHSLSSGTGALILFGSVQLTMISWGISRGERPSVLEWTGLTIALVGLGYLVWPKLAAPSVAGSALMVVAGVSWGIYSVRGRSAGDPVIATTGNFVRSVPFALLVVVGAWRNHHIEPAGVALAVLSGAITSGLGYVVWYRALKGLSATRAATVQLAVPVLAAIGGVLLLSESISIALVIAATLVLGGIGLALRGRSGPR